MSNSSFSVENQGAGERFTRPSQVMHEHTLVHR